MVFLAVQKVKYLDHWQQITDRLDLGRLIFYTDYQMAKLTRDEILKLARLAKLELTEDEIDEYTRELSSILDYVELLDTVDVKGLKPTSQVTGLTNVMRADEIVDYGTSQDDLLKNAPTRKGAYIQVKRVL